jgi:hypothetical protein
MFKQRSRRSKLYGGSCRLLIAHYEYDYRISFEGLSKGYIVFEMELTSLIRAC